MKVFDHTTKYCYSPELNVITTGVPNTTNFFSLVTNFFMLFPEILLLATKSENLVAKWPQCFSLKVQPYSPWNNIITEQNLNRSQSRNNFQYIKIQLGHEAQRTQTKEIE